MQWTNVIKGTFSCSSVYMLEATAPTSLLFVSNLAYPFEYRSVKVVLASTYLFSLLEIDYLDYSTRFCLL
jgi:hypothetical protein